jgi:hypothetical protein
MYARVVIAIFFATAIHTSFVSAQEDRAFAHGTAMVMLDNSIPDFVAMTKLDGIVSDKEKEFGYLALAKKHSLEIRKKHIRNTQDTVIKRIDETEKELNRFQKSLEEMEKKAQSKSSVYASSMASAEQLLISAQLELQKVAWELATEQELLGNLEKAEVNSKTVGNEIEREALMLQLENLQTNLQFAEKELATVENLEKRGAIGASEAAKAKQTFANAKNALRICELRLREQEMKYNASAKAQSAEITTQVRKLTARKTHIEKYIQELLSSMNDLSQRQIILARIGHVEKRIEAYAKLHEESMTKQDEIDGLLSILETAELSEKKVKE